ncbi:SpoIID/LytB domain-containing protein [Halobacteroides halobius]|nr:SpoIID/LytB domain-containing protein [Halobacteroides halobius]
MVLGIVIIGLLFGISLAVGSFYLAPKEQISQGQEQKKVEKEPVKKEPVKKLLTVARQAYYQGDYQSSIKQYKRIAKEFKSQQALLNLATIYEELGKYQLAAKSYQRLLKLDSQPQVRLGLGIAYYNLGQLQRAKQQLSKAVATGQQDYLLREAHYYLGLSYKQQQDYKLAATHLQKSLKQINFALGYYQLGQVRFAQGKYQQARDLYHQALETDGSLKGVARELALSYLKAGQIGAAIKYFKAAHSENSSDQLVNQELAKLQEKYPQYFESTPAPVPTPGQEEPITREDLPTEVDFKTIKPLPQAGPQIRVGIMTNQPQVFFRVGSDFSVKQGTKIVATGEKGQIVKASYQQGSYQLDFGEQKLDFSKPVKIVPQAYVPILVHNVKYGQNYYWGGKEDRQYRGLLELRPAEQGVTVVNLVHLEEYLAAVVPSEMSASWPLGALKVQAVAARSYTLANLGRHVSEGFDLCSTVHCAAYRGLSREYQRSTQAVRKTAGDVMTYQGEPINAVYSANSGGHTEDSEDIWSGEVPYLRGVSTAMEETEFPLPPAKLKKWLKKIPQSYSADKEYTKLSHYRWQRSLAVDYLENRLGIEDIKQIIPTLRSEAGSVKALQVVGAKQTKVFKDGIRWRFGGLRNNRFWIQPRYEDGQVVDFLFYGSGWGHSVGMDQVAVASMADHGKNYKKILHHFYTDIKLENWY